MPSTLTIATRESPLALWQAEYVRSALQAAHPGLTVGLLGMTHAVTSCWTCLWRKWAARACS